MSGFANSVRRFMVRVHTFDAQPARHTAVVAAFTVGTGALSLATYYALRTDHYGSNGKLAHLPREFKVPEEFANQRS